MKGSQAPDPSCVDHASGGNVLPTTTVDRLLFPIVLVALALSALILVAGKDGPLLGRVLAMWVIWTPIGVAFSARGLRDPAVASRGNPFQRAGVVVRTWVGLTGVLTATALITVLLMTAPNTWLSYSVLLGGAVAAAAMLFVRGTVRHVGTGLLITAIAPAWVFVVLFVAALAVPIIITVCTAAVCTVAERRRRCE